MKNVKLKSFEVYSEPTGCDGINKYFAKVVYEHEDEKGVWETTYPKIVIPIEQYDMPKMNHCFGDIPLFDFRTVDLGFGDLPVIANEDNIYAVSKLVKPKIHEMTIAEIEKKLGYKIRIKGEEETK